MPLPTPNEDEKEDKFISRCMANPMMNKEFPKNEQRAAVCYSQFRKKKKQAKASEEIRWDDESLAQILKDEKGIFLVDMTKKIKGI